MSVKAIDQPLLGDGIPFHIGMTIWGEQGHRKHTNASQHELVWSDYGWQLHLICSKLYHSLTMFYSSPATLVAAHTTRINRETEREIAEWQEWLVQETADE